MENQTLDTAADVQPQDTTGTPAVESTVETTVASGAAEVDSKVETPVAPQQVVSFEDGLKDFGFTKEELVEMKAAREAKKAEAEKPIKEQSEWADKVQFGIQNKLITKEELESHTILSTKKDIDLLFEAFEYDNEFEYEGEDLENAKMEAFNEVYNIDSSNAKAKAKGEQLMKVDAEALRASISEKINAVNSAYVENKISKEFYNDRNEVLADLNKNGYSEKINIDGVDIEVNIPVATTESEIREFLTSDNGAPILKLMRDVYKDNKEGAKQMFKEYLINANKTQAVAKTAYEAGLEAGKATSIGATAPFNSKQVLQTNASNTTEDQQKQESRRAAAGIRY
jgi:hypothetical protein